MRCLKPCLLLIFSVAVLPLGVVHAQDYTDELLEGDPYLETIYNLKRSVGEGLGSGQGKVGNITGDAEGALPPFLGSGEYTCDEEDEECKIERGPVAIEAGPQSRGVYSLPPIRGFKDWMNANARVDLSSSMLTSPAALHQVTWQMVEPGIATGFHNAALQTEASLTNRFLSELAFISQMNTFPHLRDFIADPYFECMSEKQKTYPWVQAQAICSGDTVTSDVTQGEFEQDATGEETYNYSDSESWDTDRTGEENRILLTDYLFAQEGYDEDSVTDGESFATKYRELVGDIEFVLNEPTSDATANVRTITKRRIPPEHSPKELWGGIVERRYGTILMMLWERCSYEQEERGVDINRIVGPGSSFWNLHRDMGEHDPANFWVYLSVPGFQFTDALGDVMWSLFLRSHGDPDIAEIRCDDIIELWNLVDPQVTAAQPQDHVRAYLWFSQNIATADMYLLYGSMEQWLGQLTSGSSGSVENVIKSAAFEQLYNITQVEEIHMEYGRIIAELQEAERHLQRVYTAETGREAGVFRSIGEQSKKPTTHLNTQPQG